LVLAYSSRVSANIKIFAAGVAMFLFDMLSLVEGFRAFTDGGLERIQWRTTLSTGKCVLFGFVSTTLMQSNHAFY
jgi:Na+/phosphate symporter